MKRSSEAGKIDLIKRQLAESISRDENLKKKKQSPLIRDQVAAHFIQLKLNHQMKQANKRDQKKYKDHDEIKRKLSNFDFYGYKPWEARREKSIPEFNSVKYKQSKIAPGYHHLNPDNRLRDKQQSKELERG